LYLGGTVASNSIRTPEATMPKPARRSVILASPSASRPDEVDRLNAILEKAGLGRPLGPPELSTPAVVVLPVSTDPRKVVAALRQAAPKGGDHRYAEPSTYGVDTIEHRATTDRDLVATEKFTEKFRATGLKSGHGTVSWERVRERAMPPRLAWQPAGPHPVVAVLDSGVKKHPWLPKHTPTHPRFWFAPQPGPRLPAPVSDPALDTGDFGAYWGHATFLAGLIRLHAPDAQVMSVKLMNDAGKIDESNVLAALQWLHHEYMPGGHVVDVVLMAFGRPKKPGEGNPLGLPELITQLGRKGVKFVASAGNDHSDQETIPACLATHKRSHVVSVGAGISAKDREWYSNYGPWVREWRPGTVVSLMPLTGSEDKGKGFALWSGTSFSAAILAGELAQARAAERAASGGS
jgi:hypothetical protein